MKVKVIKFSIFWSLFLACMLGLAPISKADGNNKKVEKKVYVKDAETGKELDKGKMKHWIVSAAAIPVGLGGLAILFTDDYYMAMKNMKQWGQVRKSRAITGGIAATSVGFLALGGIYLYKEFTQDDDVPPVILDSTVDSGASIKKVEKVSKGKTDKDPAEKYLEFVK